VIVRKVAEDGPFTHVLLNKGALTKTCAEHKWEVFGLHGQVAYFYVKDLQIDHFRWLHLERAQNGIHVCTFEDVLIENVVTARSRPATTRSR
jgi:hypothetical protein